tara:strand:+ start:202 stop:600 length:399 start_codon:yes stop_codon:yes gene_type:complete
MNDIEFTDAPDDIEGFVYVITDKRNDKKYVGKKRFWSVTRKPPLKGKKRKRVIRKESDWMKYYGSSDLVNQLLVEHGEDNFRREIIHLCRTKGEMSYLEAKEQFDRNVLLNDDYYNEFIGCKIHSKHVSGLK